MAKRSVLAILVIALSFAACGDEGSSNPNTISILDDVGMADIGSDASQVDAGADADLDMGADIDESTAFISIAPQRPYVSLQQTKHLTATLKIDNVEVPDAVFEWESLTPEIASVDQDGNVTGIAAGEASILASFGETSSLATVLVYSVHKGIAAGAAHSCTAKVDGRVTCWGANDSMQAGRLDKAIAATAEEVQILGDELVLGIYAGFDHSCATTNTGSARCWGNNRSNQLGPLTTELERATPGQVVFGSPVKKMALGKDFSCALLENSTIRCWGGNSDKVINASSDAIMTQPTNTQPSLAFRDLAAGDSHVCGLASDFNLYCWGDNSSNQLGENAVGNGGHDPVRIGNTQYTAVAAYGDQTCAFSLFQGLQCWGSSDGGFGDLALISTPTPTTIPLVSPNFQRMSIGGSHACVVTADITYCWGKNDKGQLGDNTVVDHALPEPVFGSPNFEHLACGQEHCCAIGPRGDVFCWGENADGQLGDGSGSPQRLPVFAPPTAL